MRRPLALLLLVAFTSGCALLPSRPPDLAYFPSPRKPGTIQIAHTLYRAAEAAGDDPGRYTFALIQSGAVTAFAAEDATFYFSDGLARQPQRHVDALVAQKVAHEVLGHAGQRRILSLSISGGFALLGFFWYGLGLADFVVNPLIVRAFSREQQLSADQRAIEILRDMGHAAPRRTLAEALRAAAARRVLLERRECEKRRVDPGVQVAANVGADLVHRPANDQVAHDRLGHG